MEHAIRQLHEVHDAFEEAMRKHDYREGYEPARYAHEAMESVKTYIEAHYRHGQLMSGKDMAILSAAIKVLEERANG